MKIGIFGGTFDPVHQGHLIIAEQVREQLQFDRIWMMPAASPPHKQGETVTDSRHRLRMLQLAIKGNPFLEISTVELDHEGLSYTYDTMRWLKEHHPEHQYAFIIGADMVEYLPHWHRVDELLHMIPFVAVGRRGYSLENPLPSTTSIELVEIPLIDVSSSMIREKVRRGESVRYLVPEEVEAYIKEHRLYAK